MQQQKNGYGLTDLKQIAARARRARKPARRHEPAALADPTARRDRPDDLDLAVAYPVHLVDHVGHHAAVIRDTLMTSPTLGFAAEREKSSMPCSSDTFPTTASGYSTIRPKSFRHIARGSEPSSPRR